MQDNVTQADREAARSFVLAIFDEDNDAAATAERAIDAFAAHRLASTTAQTEAVQKLVEALEKAVAFYDNLSRPHDEGEAKLLDEMAAAIAAHRESLP